MQNDPSAYAFVAQRERYFDSLCRNLGLVRGEEKSGAGFDIVSASSGNVRVFFEHERGLCSFAVGAASESEPLCGVEELVERFPRLRAMSEGIQRLSLEEQRAFVESRWADLQMMFSAEHLSETRKWHAAAVAACTKKFTRQS